MVLISVFVVVGATSISTGTDSALPRHNVRHRCIRRSRRRLAEHFSWSVVRGRAIERDRRLWTMADVMYVSPSTTGPEVTDNRERQDPDDMDACSTGPRSRPTTCHTRIA
jgi:hypothetical protein